MKEIKNLIALPKLNKIKLNWDLNDDSNVNHIEIFGKYCNNEHFWKYDGFHRATRAVDLWADPLAPVTYDIQLVFNDGSRSKGKTVKSTAIHRNVKVDEFEGRKLLVYLPDGYEKEKTRYPVIYMHDGQNLFSERLSYIWEWQVDDILNRLIQEGKMQKVVVVGIYNSSKRAEEYTPFADRDFGGGKAREFSALIVDRIIPYIEKKYRVSRSRSNRAVMGSSFGGILSLWMGYTYPEVFSMVGAISPSLWIADGAMLLELEKQPKKPIKIWIDQGTGEWSDFTRNAVTILKQKGYRYGRELFYYEAKGEEHNEVAWSRRVECPFIIFKGKRAREAVDLRLDINLVPQFAVGPHRMVVNPVAKFDNGLWYSLFSSAKYSVEGSRKNAARIDPTGILIFNGERRARVNVRYRDIKRAVTIENPYPVKKIRRRKYRKPKRIKKTKNINIDRRQNI